MSEGFNHSQAGWQGQSDFQSRLTSMMSMALIVLLASRIAPNERRRVGATLCRSAFCRMVQSLSAAVIQGQTPAMAAGITGKVWSLRELLENAAIS